MTGIRFARILMEEPTRTVEHPPRDVFRQLVKGDLRNGIPPSEARRLLREMEADEHYEACAGILQALQEDVL